VVLQYNSKHIPNAIKRMFIHHGENGLMSLQLELCRTITNGLASSELYNNYDRNFCEHGRLLDQQINSSTGLSNVQTSDECGRGCIECPRPPADVWWMACRPATLPSGWLWRTAILTASRPLQPTVGMQTAAPSGGQGGSRPAGRRTALRI
jgi:hypothetical protein